MNTKEKNRKTKDARSKPVANTGRYPSAEAASAAKIDVAAQYIDTIDMTLFKKNGPVE